MAGEASGANEHGRIEEELREGGYLNFYTAQELDETHRECSIYKVPVELRVTNEEAYTPKLIFIGPLSYTNSPGNDDEHVIRKRRYLTKFCNRGVNLPKLKEIKDIIQANYDSIFKCYSTNVHRASKTEFFLMFYYDSIFIIEIFLRNCRGETDDPWFNQSWIKAALIRDLQLLENQLPFAVLDSLYQSAFGDQINRSEFHSFTYLSLCFFYGHELANAFSRLQLNDKHFTDLSRWVLSKSRPIYRSGHGGKIEELPSAVKLYNSGVSFTVTRSESLLGISVGTRKPWKIFQCWKQKELTIPVLEIGKDTECLFRNLMALEQCHYPNETHICNYVIFMSFLMNTEKDVAFLVEKGIVRSFMEHAEISRMFRSLCQKIEPSESCFYGIGNWLIQHYKSGGAKARLMSLYFKNHWRGSGTVAALILLILALTQAVCSVMQVIDVYAPTFLDRTWVADGG